MHFVSPRREKCRLVEVDVSQSGLLGAFSARFLEQSFESVFQGLAVLAFLIHLLAETLVARALLGLEALHGFL